MYLSGAWLYLGGCKIGLEISRELAFPPHAAVLNFRGFFFSNVCENAFEDVRYGISHIYNSGMCVYI